MGTLVSLLHLPPAGQDGEANLVSSLCEDGLHRLAIDIDGPAVTLRESCTPGHYHLLIDHRGMEWDRYQILLELLAEAGIVEEAYVEHSIERGQTLLRKPGVPRMFERKVPTDHEDVDDDYF